MSCSFLVPKMGLVSRPKAAEQRSLAECGEERAEGEKGRPDRVTNSASGRGKRKGTRAGRKPVSCSFLVPKIGLEPIRSCPRRILSPLCLPFHHSGEREKTTGEPRCLLIGGTTQTRTGGKGFAGLCLTTWLWCHVGAGDETRTRDNYLGKVALYH